MTGLSLLLYPMTGLSLLLYPMTGLSLKPGPRSQNDVIGTSLYLEGQRSPFLTFLPFLFPDLDRNSIFNLFCRARNWNKKLNIILYKSICIYLQGISHHSNLIFFEIDVKIIRKTPWQNRIKKM